MRSSPGIIKRKQPFFCSLTITLAIESFLSAGLCFLSNQPTSDLTNELTNVQPITQHLNTYVEPVALWFHPQSSTNSNAKASSQKKHKAPRKIQNTQHAGQKGKRILPQNHEPQARACKHHMIADFQMHQTWDRKSIMTEPQRHFN